MSRISVLGVLSYLVLAAFPVLGARLPDGLEPCPYWELLHSSFHGTLGPGSEASPYALRSFCQTNATWTRSPSQVTDTYMNVTVHHTNETWNSDANKDKFLSAIDVAVTRGLDLLATQAGNATVPLEFHITITNWDMKKMYREYRDRLTSAISWNSWSNGGDPDAGGTSLAAKKCYLIVGHPPDPNVPLTVLQKDIVNRMALCVQAYHRPSGLRSYSHDWSWQSLARFVDGLLWPTPVEMLPPDPEFTPRTRNYPEQYAGLFNLQYAQDTGAILWHYALNTGWSLDKIFGWCKDYHVDGVPTWSAVSKVLAGSSDLRALWHPFARALVVGDITYPSGERIKVLPIGIGPSAWETWRDVGSRPWSRQSLVFEPGEERDIARTPPGGSMQNSTVEPWEVQVFKVAVAGGQVLDWTIRPRDVTWLSKEDEFAVDYSRDVEWSYRKVGEKDFIYVGVGGPARIVVPEGVAGTSYEFLVTCTGGGYNKALVEMLVRRV